MPHRPLTLHHDPLRLIGCGAMAGAMLGRWLDAGLDPALITVVRPSGADCYPGVRVVRDAAEIGDTPPPALLIIALKPQQLSAAAPSIAAQCGPDTVIISILAGLPIADLRLAFPSAGPIIRAMPNMPVARGQGVIALSGAAANTPLRDHIDTLFAPLGLRHWIDDDGTQFDLVTAIAGCGPAFTYRFAAALAAAGTRLGLDPADADTLARATVAGAAATAAATDDTPLSDLARAVASPGGMTQAGLDVLDADGRLVALLTDTVRAARDRGRELAHIARPVQD